MCTRAAGDYTLLILFEYYSAISLALTLSRFEFKLVLEIYDSLIKNFGYEPSVRHSSGCNTSILA